MRLAVGLLRRMHWQITPTALVHMLGDPDRAAAARAQAAMLTMKKIDIAA